MLRKATAVLFAAAVLALQPSTAIAHCDALDGPVVKAARAALDANDLTPVLRWVNADHEPEIRSAFERTVAVRKLGPDARMLAETWFFETLVRIHRAGEGAPFDGLKPAGHIEPFALAVDRTLETGSADDLLEDLSAHVTGETQKRFARARDARAKADSSVEAGREFVAAYVDYMHYVEALHRAGAGAAHEHQAPVTEPLHKHQN
jgi:hypothetical protein